MKNVTLENATGQKYIGLVSAELWMPHLPKNFNPRS